MIDSGPKTSDQQELIIGDLEHRGALRFIPDNVSAGMPYVSVRDAVNLRLTKFSQTHINKLSGRGIIETFRVGNQLHLTLDGVRQLRAYERDSEAGKIRAAGQRPGGRWLSRPGHHPPPD